MKTRSAVLNYFMNTPHAFSYKFNQTVGCKTSDNKYNLLDNISFFTLLFASQQSYIIKLSFIQKLTIAMNLKLCTMVIALCLLILQINIYILFSKYWQPNLPSTHIDYSSKTETARPLPHNIFEFVLRLAYISLNFLSSSSH